MSLKSFTFALVTLLGVAATAPAATVNYTLDLSVDNVWTLLASTSAGDNAGLAFYDVPLTGNFLTFDHVAPNVVNSANFAPAGFGVLRTADSAAPIVDLEILASQDVINAPAANLVYGVGQEASSFATKGITPAFIPDATSQVAWLSPIVLATGTYNRAAGALAFNAASANLVANVFATAGSRDAPAATVTTNVIPFGVGQNTPPTVVPPAPNAGVTAGQVLVGDFNATDLEDPAGPFTFSGLNLASFVASHGGTNPAGLFTTAASLNTSTGEVTWDTTGFARGTYLIEATVADPDGATAVAPGQWSVTITAVPEPSTLALCGLALVGSLGMVRRRNG